MEQKKHNLSKL